MAEINDKKLQPNAPKEVKYHESAFTLPNGCPVDNPVKTEKVKQNNGGSIQVSQLLQDIYLIDGVSHITRERIPERFVHARGAGARGVFEVTSDDINKYTCADFLKEKGKKTPLIVRFSTTAGEKGSADTVRDTRGFAFKLYTDEGNLDWAFFHPAVFPIRDPGKFTSLVHATKREPSSNSADPSMFWNFFNHNLEGYNAVTRFFSDEGTPKAYSHVNISSVHSYSFTKDGSHSFVRLTLDPVNKVDPFRIAEAVEMAGKDPDFHARTLYTTINICNAKKSELEKQVKAIEEKIKKTTNPEEKKKLENEKAQKLKDIEKLPFPAWKVMAQIITPEQVQAAKNVNLFDPTKIPPSDLGIIKEIGKITLNDNPKNFFAEVEQAAFAPANFVPGWDMSPDPILQIRLFPYGDTQRHRLGPNADQLPVNRPNKQWNPTRRDGPSNIFNYEDIPNYIAKNEKTKATPPTHTLRSFTDTRWGSTGMSVERSINAQDTNELLQPWQYYDIDLAKDPMNQDPTYKAKAAEKGISYNQWGFVFNVAQHLSGAKEEIRKETYDVFTQMDRKHREKGQPNGQPTKQNLGVLIKEETENAVKARGNTIADIPKEIGYSAQADDPGAPPPLVSQSLDTVRNAYKSMAHEPDA